MPASSISLTKYQAPSIRKVNASSIASRKNDGAQWIERRECGLPREISRNPLNVLKTWRWLTIYDKQLCRHPLQICPARKSSIGMPDHCSQRPWFRQRRETSERSREGARPNRWRAHGHAAEIEARSIAAARVMDTSPTCGDVQGCRYREPNGLSSRHDFRRQPNAGMAI
jgi:hypothetical protein